MLTSSYASPSNPQISLPRLSILGQPPLLAASPLLGCDKKVEVALAASTPAFIMIGIDDSGKPHASWFAAEQADAAAKAAGLMDMALIEVSRDLAALAAELPQGKLFESGKAFVPFVKRSTYDLLAAHLSDDYLTAAAQRVEAAATAASADYAKASKGEVGPRNYPDHWSKIAPGDVVLASEGHDDGWWEATVVGAQGSGNYLLAWSDWPELDQFVRHVTQLALLHPKFTSEAPE
jgi:hypothetical protein